MKRVLLGTTGLMLLALAGVVVLLQRPHQGFSGERFVDIPKGTGSMAIAQSLADAGVVQHPWLLAAVRATQPSVRWQAGEYRFAEPASPWEIAGRLARGDVYLVELRIPEGLTIFETAKAVAEAGLAEEADFLALAKDPASVRDIAPAAPSLEGFLFPSTYHVPRRIGAAGLVRMLTAQFRKEWQSMARPGADVLKTLTLASLVEKETGVADERAIVASVYTNRVKSGMKLEADPTTIYAAILEGKWKGTIYRSDLDRVHPYNTYAVPGMPPGPVASPGRAAIAAALAPAETDYLFFVARGDGTGGHNFSKNYADHQRFVAAWRRGRSD